MDFVIIVIFPEIKLINFRLVKIYFFFWGIKASDEVRARISQKKMRIRQIQFNFQINFIPKFIDSL